MWKRSQIILTDLLSKNHFRNYNIFCPSLPVYLFFLYPFTLPISSYLYLYLALFLLPLCLPLCNSSHNVLLELFNRYIQGDYYKEQPPARNLSVAVRRVLQGSNVANQGPPFWPGLKSTNPAISSQLKSCVLLVHYTYCSRLHLGLKRWPQFSPSQYRLCTLDGVKRGFRCTFINKSSILLYSTVH
jgi:hypothetical protein